MKIKSLIYTVLLAGLLSPLLINCKKETHEQAAKEPEYVKNDSIKQNVFIINSGEATLKSDSVKLAQGIYEFQFSGAPLKFSAGDIIVGQDGQGFLRKVISSTIRGNIVTLETEQATLEDLFTDAHISFQLDLSDTKSANMRNAILKETKINYVEKGIVMGNGFSFDFSNTTIYQNGPLTFKITKGI